MPLLTLKIEVPEADLSASYRVATRLASTLSRGIANVKGPLLLRGAVMRNDNGRLVKEFSQLAKDLVAEKTLKQRRLEKYGHHLVRADLALSEPVRRKLENARIETLAQLCAMSQPELDKAKIGPRSQQRIKDELARLGLD